MPAQLLRRQVRSIVIKLARLSFGPLVEPRDIHLDLAVGCYLYFGPIHRTRRRTFEVDALAVVSAPVARAFEFVLAGFPVRGTSQVGATSVNDKDSIRRAVNPDSIFLLPFGIN